MPKKSMKTIPTNLMTDVFGQGVSIDKSSFRKADFEREELHEPAT